METNAKTQVYNLVILDKSGSMESIRKEAMVTTKHSAQSVQLKPNMVIRKNSLSH